MSHTMQLMQVMFLYTYRQTSMFAWSALTSDSDSFSATWLPGTFFEARRGCDCHMHHTTTLSYLHVQKPATTSMASKPNHFDHHDELFIDQRKTCRTAPVSTWSRPLLRKNCLALRSCLHPPFANCDISRLRPSCNQIPCSVPAIHPIGCFDDHQRHLHHTLEFVKLSS